MKIAFPKKKKRRNKTWTVTCPKLRTAAFPRLCLMMWRDMIGLKLEPAGG